MPVATANPSIVPAALVVIATLTFMAAFAGLATALVGTMADNRAIYYVAVLVLLAIGGMVTFTRKEPLRFAFLALIACFPIATAEIPPGRFGLTVFHAVMFALMIGFVGRKMSDTSSAFTSFFPTRTLLAACLLIIPCIVFSQYPLWSMEQFLINNVTVYFFLLFTLEELQTEKGFERLVFLLSIALLFMSGGLYIDHFLHFNLSLRGSNLNQSTISESGLSIYRAGGFFQDPQRAGAYLACMITFLLLLSVRGRFSGMKIRFLVWIAIVASLGALATTISRGAILSCVLVSALALFLFNKWNAVAKLLVLGIVFVVATTAALTPAQTWLSILPKTTLDRFLTMSVEVDSRLSIWSDTWDMFADHPVSGIGIGSFRPYLIDTRPAVFNYYDIGTAAGVAYIPDQPESGYLKILYEGGILGSLAALLVVGDALRRTVVLMADGRRSAHARTEAVAALAGIATFGATFVTLYVSADQRVAALFTIFLAVILHRSLQDPGISQQAARPTP